MAQPLGDVPNGTDILIDTNIFVYGLTAKSPDCKTLLERCSKEEITGITLFEVLHEATHQFMKAEAVQKGLCTGQALKYLTGHPEQVKRLTDYWVNAQHLLALNLLFLPMEEHVITAAQVERMDAGLLTNDSIIVAAMREYGISRIATNDRLFDAVLGITVFSPTDIDRMPT